MHSFLQFAKEIYKLVWTPECQKAFEGVQNRLSKPPSLSKPIDGRYLFLYLASSEQAISLALVRGDEGVQCLVYYVSKRLSPTEKHYPIIKKLT